MGTKLAQTLGDSQWGLGFWLIEGREHLSDAYDKAEEITGLARATLMDIKGTAECFDGSTPSRHREGRLSWSHHKELKRLMEKEDLFVELKGLAVEKKWSVQKLRDAIDKKIHGGKPVPISHSISVGRSIYGRLKALATQQGIDIEKLVADALSAYLDRQPKQRKLKSA
jgi:hypothetical protein